MATHEVITYRCDYGGEPIPDGTVVTRRASVDGKRFEVELCKPHSDALDEILSRFAAFAPRSAPRPEASRRRAADVRAWALAEGLISSDRGRIPASVIVAYDSRATAA